MNSKDNLPDFIAKNVATWALVCEGDETLEDLGIMEIKPGQVILKCHGAECIDMDKLKPIPGFTRDDIYRDTMREYIEWMEKATALMRDMAGEFERLDSWAHGKGFCYGDMSLPRFAERLREFGIEV